MTCRLPFQIIRAVSLSRPGSPNSFLKPNTIRQKFQYNNTTVSETKIVQCSGRCKVRKSISSLPHYAPHYYFQHRYKSTDLENRKKGHKQHKCNEKIYKRKYELRDTSWEECIQYFRNLSEKYSSVHKLKTEYDESKLKWKHDKSKTDTYTGAHSVDNTKGQKTVKRNLPKSNNNSENYISSIPTKEPKINRPQTHENLEDDQNCVKYTYYPKRSAKLRKPNRLNPPKMDDVELQTESEEVPKYSLIDIYLRYVPNYLKRNKFIKLKKKCNTVQTNLKPMIPEPIKELLTKLEQKYSSDKNTYNMYPPSLHEDFGRNVKRKDLTILPSDSGSNKCNPHYPNRLPKLVLRKKKFDPFKTSYTHCRSIYKESLPKMDKLYQNFKTVVNNAFNKYLSTKTPQCVPTKRRYPKVKWDHSVYSKELWEYPINKNDYSKIIPNSKIHPKNAYGQKQYNNSEKQWNNKIHPKDLCEHPMKQYENELIQKWKNNNNTEKKKCDKHFYQKELCEQPMNQYDDSKKKKYHRICRKDVCDYHPKKQLDDSKEKWNNRMYSKELSVQYNDANTKRDDRICRKDLCDYLIKQYDDPNQKWTNNIYPKDIRKHPMKKCDSKQRRNHKMCRKDICEYPMKMDEFRGYITERE